MILVFELFFLNNFYILDSDKIILLCSFLFRFVLFLWYQVITKSPLMSKDNSSKYRGRKKKKKKNFHQFYEKKNGPMAWETGVQSQVESYQRLKKMELDATLLSTRHYKVRIKCKEEQSKECSSVLPYT